MKRFARVTAIWPEKIEAVLEKPLRCAGCRGGCGKTGLKWFSGDQPDRIVIYRQAYARLPGKTLVDHQGFFNRPVHVGDRFALEFDDNAMMASAWHLYAMPLAFLVAGLAAFFALFKALGWPADLGGVLGAVGGLFLSRFFIRRYAPAHTVFFS